MTPMFGYGQRVRDRITGVCGRVIALMHNYGHKTDEYRVVWVGADGSINGGWFPTSQLEVLVGVNSDVSDVTDDE